MQTAMEKLKQVLENEIKFVGNLHDTKEDKTVASYLRTVIDEIDNRYMELEKQQIIDACNEGGEITNYDTGMTHEFKWVNGLQYFNQTFNK